MKRKWKRDCNEWRDRVVSELRAFVRINTFEALMKGRDYYPGYGLFYCVEVNYVMGYRKRGGKETTERN